ncbi:uncharacterized protein TNIN_104871 [Trichonephila inaurata madagascariensis]|uniref:Uncharacterized protein n=1 Tax=Trichonephila inaurata madagascariensis TaxID=2747483 RepID=A0A8X7BR13_9ARAC|nr:uncharacterized protein TNIN_104871 [Trichonephila inaurata madagascariensis]
MTYLAKALKDDLKTLATELGLEIREMMRVIDFKNLILTSKDYDEQFIKTLLETIIETRLKKKVPKEVKEHIVDIWGDIKSSSELIQKLDDYEIDRGTAFADSGASHSIAGATLYTLLLQQGAAFEKTFISLSLADGIVTQKEVLRTFQTVLLEGRKFKTPFIILSDTKNNSTLLGVDFLENAGIVLNFRKNCWTFCADSRKSYNFVTPYQSTFDPECGTRQLT